MSVSDMVAHAKAVRARLHRPPNAWVGDQPRLQLEPITCKTTALGVLLEYAASRSRVGIADIKGGSRMRHIVAARHLVCYLGTASLGMSLVEVADHLDLCHTSVKHAKERVQSLLTEPSTKRAVDEFNDLYAPAFAVSSIHQPDMAAVGQKHPPQSRIQKVAD